MKSVSLALLTAAVSVAAAQPHAAHRHAHLHKRDATEVAWIPGPTVVAYVLNGQPISEAEVQQGIANGTLVWSNGSIEPASEVASPPAATSTPSVPSAPWAYSSPAPVEASSSDESSSSSDSSESGWSGKHGPPGGWGNHGGHGGPPSGSPWGGSGEGVDTSFPDGELSCSEFPSSYGAVPVMWAGLGGWTGVQTPKSFSGGYGDISTATHGGGCEEGSFCSYACPPGYQKSQWPETQGSTGQSVGGIECKNGKLYLTNKALSDKLCIKGASNVDVQVQNKLSSRVAVCRTDYPGTESETVPLDSQPGTSTPLTCPDASNYYTWQGAHTSAQYYVNPAGVSVEDGCQWGSDANPWGNFAPMNLGVGYSNGAAWLSIFQNAPTTDAKLDFAVEIVGDGVVGTCKYSNGQYCGGANYDDCSSTTGCTVRPDPSLSPLRTRLTCTSQVSLTSGTATFVFTDS